jgi:hypothetical protein
MEKLKLGAEPGLASAEPGVHTFNMALKNGSALFWRFSSTLHFFPDDFVYITTRLINFPFLFGTRNIIAFCHIYKTFQTLILIYTYYIPTHSLVK